MQKNENREGYKKTKAGWIPEEWDNKAINKVTSYVDYRGKTPRKASSGRFLVTAKNIQFGFINYENSKEYIPEETYDSVMSRGKPKIGDVLITTEAPLGNVAAVDHEYIALAQRVIKYRAEPKELTNKFLKHFLMGKVFQSQLEREATGGTVKGIKGSRLHKLSLALPPLPEQKAIADVLECWDRAIKNLELKIEKKRLVKKGLQQRLLSGRLRLPEFATAAELKIDNGELRIPSGWKSVRLGDVARINTKSLRQNTSPDYEFYYIDLSCVAQGRITFPTTKVHFKTAPSRARREFKRGDVLMATVRPNLMGHAFINFEVKDMVCTTGFAVVSEVPHKLHMQFFYAHLFGTRLNIDIQNLLTGSNYPAINSSDVENLNLLLPPIPEQKAIANVLSVADSELEALEKKLVLWKDQKKYLLNNLVTGTIRIPEFKDIKEVK